MDKYSKAVLTDAKQQYTSGLIDMLTEPIYIGLTAIYKTARSTSKSNNLNTLKTFQILLSKTPKWDNDKVDKEITRIKTVTDCDYLEDLVTAVFVTHAKILISIKSRNKTDTIDLNVPKIAYFIHMIYIQCARNFWRQPWLFHTGYKSLDLQRNLIKAENLIKESILEAIRKLLPIKEVLKQYLGNNFIDQDFTDYSDEDITSTISERTRTNIKKLLKYELDNNLETIGETKDFSKIVVSDEFPPDVKYANLSPENFDNRTVEEPYIKGVSTNAGTAALHLEKDETATQYDQIENNNDTETQYDQVENNNDTETQYEEANDDILNEHKIQKTSPMDDQIVEPDDTNESDTDTVFDSISVLGDTVSVETNLVNNFSFFEDAAEF